MEINWILITGCFLSSLKITISANEVLGCGGYIRSEVDIDFSQVQLKLYTNQLNLKYETECAPNNGYYFIPLYDKGHYILKVSPPQGWSFDPSEVELKVDGENDPCSKNEDIDFLFKGFAVIGRVVSLGSDFGPKGVSVSLKQNKKEMATTTTGENGDFLFTPLAAGSYEVVAHHPRWKLLKNKVQLNVVDKNGDAGNELVIAGYNLVGKFVNFDPSLVQYIKIVLHSSLKRADTEIECAKEKLEKFVSASKLPVLCHVKVDSDGTFRFSGLPLGKYAAVPFLDHPRVRFRVEPAAVHLEIGHGDAELEESFKVVGRDIKGNVLPGKSSKSGLSAAVVSLESDHLNAEIAADEKGHFAFSELPYARYVIKINKDGYDFAEYPFVLSSSTPPILSFFPDKYQVCFSISVDSSSDLNIPWTVGVYGVDSEDTVQTGPSGRGCVNLKSGTFKASVLLSQQDQDAGIRFGPEVMEFSVGNSPIESLTFVQFLAEISGTIHCLESCRSLSFILRPAKGNSGSSKVTHSVQDKFVFKDVVPGEYLLTVDKEEWCWKNQTIELSVKKKIIAVKYVQTGFKLTLNSSHKTSLSYVTSLGHKGTLEVVKGTSRECVSAPGKYSFTSSGCHLYSNVNLSWDTSSPQLLSLIPTHHKLSGKLISNEAGPFSITIKSDRRQIDPVGPLKTSATNKDTYTFEIPLEVAESVTLAPLSSSNLFQYTPSDFTIESIDDCHLDTVTFIAERALFIKGQVNPPIKGVQIKVSSNDKDQNFTTNAQGFFIAGPLNKSLNYSVSAEKNGYVVTPPLREINTDRENASEIVKLNFDLYKLAEIVVHIVDEQGRSLEGVLISTTGGKGYRQNSLTDSAGSFTFSSLMPHDYYIRPMMKEYVFEPSSKIVKVETGATVDVQIRGKRIAYSIIGQTVSLNGESESNVVMEAVGNDRHCQDLQEEAVSDDEGYFRIRGLVPNCNYILRLKQNEGINKHVKRSLPKEIPVKVHSEDINDLQVVVMRPFLQMDVAFVVETDPQFLSSISAELYREETPDTPIQIIPLKHHNFFMLAPMIMDKKEYTVRLVSTLSKQLYSYSSPSITFIANSSFIRRTLSFEPKLKHVEAEISRSTIIFLLIAVVVVVAGLNFERVKPILFEASRNFYNVISKRSSLKSFQNFPSSHTSFSDSLTAKKRIKSKKL